MHSFRAMILAAAAVGVVGILSTHPVAAAEPVCGANTGQKATGRPILLGAIVGKTGPEDFGHGAYTAAAFFACLNNNGGIKGRPVILHQEDDGWDPAKSAAAAAKLVDDIGVFAMVGSGSFVDCTANNKFYEKKDILVVASIGIPRDCFFAPNYSSTNAGPRISTLGAAQYMVNTFGSKTVVCIAPAIPGVGDFACDGIKAWGEPKGVKYVNIQIAPAGADITSVLLQAMTSKPDLIALPLPLNGVVAFLKAAEEQDLGGRVKFTAPTSAYSANFPKEIGKYWDGKMFVQLELEPLDKQAPDTRNWHAVLEKYGSPNIRRETFSQAGYLAAKFMTDLMLKMDPATINRKTLTKALREGKNVFRSDMQCGAWYFGPGKRHNPNHAGSVAVTRNGKFETVAPCFQVEDPDLADVLAVEKALGL